MQPRTGAFSQHNSTQNFTVSTEFPQQTNLLKMTLLQIVRHKNIFGWNYLRESRLSEAVSSQGGKWIWLVWWRFNDRANTSLHTWRHFTNSPRSLLCVGPVKVDSYDISVLSVSWWWRIVNIGSLILSTTHMGLFKLTAKAIELLSMSRTVILITSICHPPGISQWAILLHNPLMSPDCSQLLSAALHINWDLVTINRTMITSTTSISDCCENMTFMPLYKPPATKTRHKIKWNVSDSVSSSVFVLSLLLSVAWIFFHVVILYHIVPLHYSDNLHHLVIINDNKMTVFKLGLELFLAWPSSVRLVQVQTYSSLCKRSV